MDEMVTSFREGLDRVLPPGQRHRIPVPDPGTGAEGGEGNGQDAPNGPDGEKCHFQHWAKAFSPTREPLLFEVLYICIRKDRIQP